MARLLKTTLSLTLSFLSESVDGGIIIRSYGKHQITRFHQLNNQKMDHQNKMWYAEVHVQQWFTLQVQRLGSLIVLLVTCSLVLLRNTLSPSIVGLAFTYALKVSQRLERILEMWSYFETNMVSPERLQEYIDIPQEAPHRLPLQDPSSSSSSEKPWPLKGEIEFQDRRLFPIQSD